MNQPNLGLPYYSDRSIYKLSDFLERRLSCRLLRYGSVNLSIVALRFREVANWIDANAKITQYVFSAFTGAEG